MENTARMSFLSVAESFSLFAYHAPRRSSVVVSEVLSRVAAVTFLSAAAALDMVMHSFFVPVTCLYAVGKSICRQKADFNLPWQHIQRVRAAVAPLLFGSAFGVIHPFMGLAMSEPTDKHVVFGILSSNTGQCFETPCSPVHSLSIIEDLALCHRYVEREGVREEIFPKEYVTIVKGIRIFEKTLESLQAQEYVHKITNSTLRVMAKITIGIGESTLPSLVQHVAVRLSGILVPLLAVVDVAIILLAQSFFLITGIERIIFGRGPIYTEITTNPLMHVSFFIQNVLKLVGNLLGTLVWFVSPIAGFKVSVLPANMFFKLQMKMLMLGIQRKMRFAEEGSRFVVPIVYGYGMCSALSVPTHNMHKTYVIIEKKNGLCNLYWVNRPNVFLKSGLRVQEALLQIKEMIAERFPFMDMKKLMNYPVRSEEPKFLSSESFMGIACQGNVTNCVVSNLFGMFEALDRIHGKDDECSRLRNKTVREYLIKRYSFYKDDFSPFADISKGYSSRYIWENIATRSESSI